MKNKYMVKSSSSHQKYNGKFLYSERGVFDSLSDAIRYIYSLNRRPNYITGKPVYFVHKFNEDSFWGADHGQLVWGDWFSAEAGCIDIPKETMYYFRDMEDYSNGRLGHLWKIGRAIELMCYKDIIRNAQADECPYYRVGLKAYTTLTGSPLTEIFLHDGYGDHRSFQIFVAKYWDDKIYQTYCQRKIAAEQERVNLNYAYYHNERFYKGLAPMNPTDRAKIEWVWKDRLHPNTFYVDNGDKLIKLVLDFCHYDGSYSWKRSYPTNILEPRILLSRNNDYAKALEEENKSERYDCA